MSHSGIPPTRIASKGESGIFSFPFRIQGDPFLPRVDAQHNSYRYRLHPPITVRAKGSPTSPFPLFDNWPAFEWNPDLTDHEKPKPPTDLGIRHIGARAYDAVRVDVWGTNTEEELSNVVGRFMGLLRHSSGQPWLGAFDFHTDHALKHRYRIDDLGRAVESPFAIISGLTPDSSTRPVSSAMWRDAFQGAAAGNTIPLYWSLYYDAQNSRARHDFRSAVMNLALSLEVARDVNYPRFADTESKSGVGFVLKPPFHDTDLLKHVTSTLRKVHSRDLSDDHPIAWKDVRALYVARHHVAHGREPVHATPPGLRPLSPETYAAWQASVHTTLVWMESL